MEALLAVKATDVPNVLKALGTEELDLLMKYVFKGMEFPEAYAANNLLVWHEKLVETAGLGAIVRVFTDRRMV